MSNTEISQVKLEKLHKYIQNGGSTDIQDVQNQLKVSSEPIVQEYKAALIAQWPEVYGKPAEEVEDDGDDEQDQVANEASWRSAAVSHLERVLDR